MHGWRSWQADEWTGQSVGGGGWTFAWLMQLPEVFTAESSPMTLEAAELESSDGSLSESKGCLCVGYPFVCFPLGYPLLRWHPYLLGLVGFRGQRAAVLWHNHGSANTEVAPGHGTVLLRSWAPGRGQHVCHSMEILASF